MDRLKVWGAVLAVSLGVFAAAAGQQAVLPKIDRIYVFGDSYSDIGEGYLDGNGPTAVAYLAERLGFRLLPANTPEVRGRSLDYAVSGARSGSGTGRTVQGALLGYGMKNQVADFAAKVRSHEIEFDPATTLFFIAGGLNDGQSPEGTTATNEKDEIRTLYGLGARRFAVALLTTAIPGFGVTGRRINPSLERIPAELRGELKDAQIRLSAWGLFYDEVLLHPAQYGITNTTDACAGREIHHEDTTPCAKPETYFYYHSAHPSTAAHKAVGDKLYAEMTGDTLRGATTMR
jgi:phospholipase/lecithinase/hemolysin